MKKSIFLKVFGGYAVIILAISALIVLLSFATIRGHYQDTLAQELEYQGIALNINVLPMIESGDTKGLDAFLKKIGKDIHARVTVIDAQGLVLADTEKDPAQMENHRYRPEVTEALEGKIGKSLRYSVTVEEKMLYVGLPIEKDGRIFGVLRMSLFMKNIDVLLHSLTMTIGRAVLITALGALLLALVFSLHFTRPIRKLTGAARQVAGGNFQTRVTILNKDEFKELGTAFNSMTGQVHRLFQEVSRQKEELIQMIASIREGLVVIEKDGKITLTNDSFKELIGEKTPEGKFHWEVIRRPKIQEFIERAMACGGLVTEEVRLDERYLLCTAGSLGPQGGLIITFHDLSDVKRVEAMKKDFFVNASHELRTPLSAIMGAMETLEDDGSCDDKATLDILKRHVERLRNIVDDLLRLSELEDKGLKLDIKDIDIRLVADSVLQLFSARFKDKGLTAEIRAAADLPRLRADAYQVEQMLINLVDNAVKYTEKGGVVISLKADPQEFIIDVEDTGSGIAPEHLPRLFERFYVVDKSRSRKLGGTGLGLAIVKHIVQLHGGTITVASKEGKGTTFTVRIPSN